MNSLITASANIQVDDFFEEVCAAIQLTPTQHKVAVGHYEAVGDILGEDDFIKQLNPFIFPQGSMRQQTTVRPIRYVEFDLDLVLRLSIFHNVSPGQVYDLVANCLRANKLYGDRLECLPRCLRLNYANDFHLDIIPAIPDRRRGGTFLYIPDRDRREWRSTNPEGYARWYEQECAKQLRILAKAQIKPVPAHLPAEQRPTLTRVTQLWKRHRDIIYKDDKDAPPSIVLTTLAAHHFNGGTNTNDALIGVLTDTRAFLNSTTGLIILNPSNPTENLTESWTAERQKKFATFVENFKNKLDRLGREHGLDRITSVLEELFGTEIGRKAVKAYSQRIEDQRRAGRLRAGITGAGLTINPTGTVRIQRNENFGD